MARRLHPEIGPAAQQGLFNLLKSQGETAVFIILLVGLILTGHKLGIPESLLQLMFFSALGVYALIRVIELFKGKR